MRRYWRKYKEWVKRLAQELKVIYIAYQDQRTPWYAKLLMILIIAYAVSPIDLIPDFIPILGLLDDMLLIPIGIYCSLKLAPPEVIMDSKLKAAEIIIKPRYWFAFIIIGIWIIFGYWILKIVVRANFHLAQTELYFIDS